METESSVFLLCSQQLNKSIYLFAQVSPLSVHYNYEKRTDKEVSALSESKNKTIKTQKHYSPVSSNEDLSCHFLMGQVMHTKLKCVINR